MAGSFDNYQVLYAPNAPAEDIRLGQLFVDESEAAPLDMLKYCSSLGPATYTSFSDGIQADLLASNNTWTGINSFSQTVTFTDAIAWQIQGTQPAFQTEETDQGTDLKKWRFRANNANLLLETRFDDNTAGNAAILFVRGTTVAVAEVRVGNATDNTIVEFLGSGVVRLNTDSKELRFGTGGDDLAIYHDGAANYIDANTGPLRLRNPSAVTVIDVGTDSTVLIPQGSPALKVGGQFTGIGSSASTALGLFINSSSAAVEQLRITGSIIRATGTSDATQPSSRYGLYTTDFATERGYWGFPTSLSDTMIMRNIAGNVTQFRLSANTTIAQFTTDAWSMDLAVRRTGVISPAQITANTDNWNPTGLSSASVIRLNTDASRNLTGITAQPSGTILTLINVGSFDVVLIDDATSTAANRFQLVGNMTVSPQECVQLWYDGTSSRWRAISVCLSAVT